MNNFLDGMKASEQSHLEFLEKLMWNKFTKKQKNVPLGSSGIQLSLETNLVTEGFRPGKVIRIRPATWPVLEVPWEEYINFKRDGIEKRFPTPDIFPEIR